MYKHHGKYAARIWENGTQCHLSTFVTPKKAALCYARHGGAERAAAEAVEPRGEGPQPLTADVARRGQGGRGGRGAELVPSMSSETGFRDVGKDGSRYQVRVRENGKMRYLGTFATPEARRRQPCATRGTSIKERAAAAVARASGGGWQWSCGYRRCYKRHSYIGNHDCRRKRIHISSHYTFCRRRRYRSFR